MQTVIHENKVKKETSINNVNAIIELFDGVIVTVQTKTQEQNSKK